MTDHAGFLIRCRKKRVVPDCAVMDCESSELHSWMGAALLGETFAVFGMRRCAKQKSWVQWQACGDGSLEAETLRSG
jgi:hypothetical protein